MIGPLQELHHYRHENDTESALKPMSSSAWFWKMTFEPWLAFLHSSSDATHVRSERCVRCIPGANNMRCLWKESMLCSAYTDFEAILFAKALRSEESNAESFSCLRKTVPCRKYRDWLHSRLVTNLKYSPSLAAKLNQLVFQCFPVKKYFECNLRLINFVYGVPECQT